MKKPSSKIIYILSFIATFFFFLWLTFPSDVLKDTVSQKVSEATGMDVYMSSLNLNLPLGISIEGLKIAKPGSGEINVDEIDVDVSFLTLFRGKLGLSLEIDNGKKGDLDLDVEIPLGGLTSGNPIPSYFLLESEKFILSDYISFALEQLANSPNMNPLIGPSLQQFEIKTGLTSKVQIDLDTNDPKNSDGQAKIKLDGLTLRSVDPSLGIPDQKFTKAQLVAKMATGAFKVEPSSKFESDQLGLSFSGVINLRKPVMRSQINLDVGLSLSGEIKENFGPLLAMILLKTDPDTWDGNAILQLSGVIASPNVSPLLSK
jgi:type II secretion system protein N